MNGPRIVERTLFKLSLKTKKVKQGQRASLKQSLWL